MQSIALKHREPSFCSCCSTPPSLSAEGINTVCDVSLSPDRAGFGDIASRRPTPRRQEEGSGEGEGIGGYRKHRHAPQQFPRIHHRTHNTDDSGELVES